MNYYLYYSYFFFRYYDITLLHFKCVIVDNLSIVVTEIYLAYKNTISILFTTVKMLLFDLCY